MKFQVFRTHFSDYLGNDFIEREKKALSSIERVNYINDESQIDFTRPLILLGSSQSNYAEFSAESLANLKLVIHANSGFDNISPQWGESIKAPIVICHEIRRAAVSEYTLFALLEHYSTIPKNNSWNRSWRRTLLQDQNILLVGFGHIGKTVFQSLLSLCKNISIYDPYKGFESNSRPKV